MIFPEQQLCFFLLLDIDCSYFGDDWFCFRVFLSMSWQRIFLFLLLSTVIRKFSSTFRAQQQLFPVQPNFYQLVADHSKPVLHFVDITSRFETSVMSKRVRFPNDHIDHINIADSSMPQSHFIELQPSKYFGSTLATIFYAAFKVLKLRRGSESSLELLER